jgi:hypothetical protein
MQKSWILTVRSRCIADLVTTNLNGSSGSGHDDPVFNFAATKRSFDFRFPEAAIRHRVQATHTRLMMFPSVAAAF